MRPARTPAIWGVSGGHQGEQLVSDRSWRCGRVDRDRAVPEHLRLEYGPAFPDLLPSRLAATRRIARIVRIQPGLLRLRVDTEQEHPVEQVQQLLLVAGDAADEHRPVMPGQDLFHPASAPHPAMRSQPLLIRALRPADPVAGGILPMRELRVIIRIDSQQAAASQLPAQR